MDLRELLRDYQPQGKHEAAMVSRLRAFLASATDETPFARDLAGTQPEWGHVTGSAWIINSSGTQTVLVHHAKLGKWVQPGGHCDGECDVLEVALREAREETGLDVTPIHTAIFDVDVHHIPEYWNTPEHFHYDVRFLLVSDDASTPVVSNESRAVRWVALDEALALNAEASIERLITKTRRLNLHDLHAR
jgi:8-oxo-dGTP pyrophosphatase MutT (NUDIX family)